MIYKLLSTVAVFGTLACTSAEHLRTAPAEKKQASVNPWALKNASAKRSSKSSVSKQSNGKKQMKEHPSVFSMVSPSQFVDAQVEAKAKNVKVHEVLRTIAAENKRKTVELKKSGKDLKSFKLSQAASEGHHEHHQHHEHERILHNKNNWFDLALYNTEDCSDGWFERAGYLLNYCLDWEWGSSSLIKANTDQGNIIVLNYGSWGCDGHPGNVVDMTASLGFDHLNSCNGMGVYGQYVDHYPYELVNGPAIVATFSYPDESCWEQDQFYAYDSLKANTCIYVNDDFDGSVSTDTCYEDNAATLQLWEKGTECGTLIGESTVPLFECQDIDDDLYWDDDGKVETNFAWDSLSTYCVTD